jgi:hypothetical protein
MDRSSPVPIRVKGEVVSLADRQAGAGYTNKDLDVRQWNGASFMVLPQEGASVDLVVEGAAAEGGFGAAMQDPMAVQLGVTSGICFELSAGCEWLRVRITAISGGSVVVVATPFVAGSGMSVSQQSVGVAAVQGTAGDVAVGAAGGSASVAYAAVPNRQHRFAGVLASYSAAPTGGRLTVSDGGTTILDVDVTAAGPTPIALPRPMKGSTNTTLTIALAAGGGAVVPKLTVLGHGTE